MPLAGRQTPGWDLTADDCIRPALAVGTALAVAGLTVTSGAILEALARAEPGGWIGEMLKTCIEDCADEVLDFVEPAEVPASRM